MPDAHPRAACRVAAAATARGTHSRSATATAARAGTAVLGGVPEAARPANVQLQHGDEPVATGRGTARRNAQKVGRNDPCWCGSGKKFKRCHGA